MSVIYDPMVTVCLCIVCRLLQVSVDKLEPSNSWIWVGWATGTQPRLSPKCWSQTWFCPGSTSVSDSEVQRFESGHWGWKKPGHYAKASLQLPLHRVIYKDIFLRSPFDFFFWFWLRKKMPFKYDPVTVTNAFMLMHSVQASSSLSGHTRTLKLMNLSWMSYRNTTKDVTNIWLQLWLCPYSTPDSDF
jgi:hypothetical protein